MIGQSWQSQASIVLNPEKRRLIDHIIAKIKIKSGPERSTSKRLGIINSSGPSAPSLRAVPVVLLS